jgi:hypothetical protein
MGRGVKGERQVENVLEVVRHHGEAAAVGQAVGVERHEDAGDDGEQPEGDPGEDQRAE